MTTLRHPHAEHLTAIAQHLNRTAEATAPNQSVGEHYASGEGGYIRVVFHSDHGGGITFGYDITAYNHTAEISVDVQHSGIETSIMVPGNVPADVIAHAAMSALRTAINAINAAQQGEEE